MYYKCPNFNCLDTGEAVNIVSDGSYFRPSDGRHIQRFRCKLCGTRFSQATFDPAFGQNKRRANYKLKNLLCSGVSLRRAAIILSLHRTTVVRKICFLAEQARLNHQQYLANYPQIQSFQFDDLQTIEHTKCKPLSVTLAVETKSRKILGAEVSQMPATGHLAGIARKKYGYREDRRPAGIEALFQKIKKYISQTPEIFSDEHPYYAPQVRKFFPHGTHQRFKGERGSLGGQGELKKVYYDPLFYLNHTCAMLRANINRLIRKTWCTTKSPQRLADHLAIYIEFHNTVLTA